ncbi:MAG: redoxin domain-containing protein [Acidobacteria bacterium]|nr:redoxin domain-containing protein [Acidobacteriota bacterium]
MPRTKLWSALNSYVPLGTIGRVIWRPKLRSSASHQGTPDDHRRFSEKKSLPIPLLADPDRAITRIYGLHWLFPVNLTRAVVVIDAKGIIRNRDVMLRAFRPSDDQLITDIYAARGDALNEQYNVLKRRFSRTGKRPA